MIVHMLVQIKLQKLCVQTGAYYSANAGRHVGAYDGAYDVTYSGTYDNVYAYFGAYIVEYSGARKNKSTVPLVNTVWKD